MEGRRAKGNEPILMNQHDVEPIILIFPSRSIQVDPAIAHLVHESIISNVPHPVQCQFRISFLQEDRFDFESFFLRFFVVRGLTGEFHSTEVIDEARSREDVECAKCSFLQGRDLQIVSKSTLKVESACLQHLRLEDHRGCRESRKRGVRR